VERLNKFQKSFFGTKEIAKANAKQIDLKDYASKKLSSIIAKSEFLKKNLKISNFPKLLMFYFYPGK